MMALLAIMFIQIIILVSQKFLGSRFFIPKFLRPNYHNYYKQVIYRPSEDEIETCAICMFTLDEEQVPVNNNEQLLSQIAKFKVKYMETPCYHKFHIKCLQSWMNVKLECPTCRRVLPPYE